MTPIPMILYCPRCGLQHVDGPVPEKGWLNPPHRSHKCHNQSCGCIWRPADVETIGVRTIETRGKADNWPLYIVQTAAALVKPLRAAKAAHPMQPLVWDRHKCIRFKENKIVSAVLAASALDLNKVAVMEFSQEDREQFAQLIGYSVSGFGDLSYVRRTVVRAADDQAEAMANLRKGT